ncbi:D-alanyl-lipoteichoic acid biosynthesis protein DltD [Enterococcus sp. 7E2_DIV0204]|uniref:D-alanyl-lipoteichoic acid biosynthesis protein DltD n=1 Tax=unclassified Enterococcus TaxID=2608891 RepID=UPI000B65F21F|nr:MULTISPECIES: D-alanyl-lipoteichoic acid biosynthesis protein DltD [unclassified Enterococcus]OTN89625.1 D-alanyl-lipoteichoic acid biosynthesis protein DltD [Enterococcus sp. 7E2_DIV0204]OTP52083.1 D-alanyl-lipoteichoic acid biosynthesis protein DltD [Enterococcus sp. 7D2_DIV0200]
MSMKKKIFAIFGPILISAVLLIAFFFAPFKIDLDSKRVLADASTSMATNVLRGNAIKNKAIGSKEYVPFFGSSELSRISPFHPTVLAEKYDRNYRPFLLGAPGTQSLTQALMMQSMGKNLAHKKVVFIISPQWFVKDGVTNDYFNAYYSELQTYQWVSDLEKVTDDDRYLAERLMDFPKVKEDKRLDRALKAIISGELPSSSDKQYINLMLNMFSREDELFGKIGMVNKDKAIRKAEKRLPTTYNVSALDQLATEIGQKSTNNNPFEISNPFYDKRVKKKLKSLENSQTNWDYRFSPEFSDLQLVLSQLAQDNAEVLFIIPPVNKHWTDFTGLSQEMLQGFAKKVKYQLTTQGFNNIADFTKDCDTQYFMADTIHLGWRGWLAADQRIQPFLETSSTKVPSYHLDGSFYSKDWQQKAPDDLK